MIGLKQSDVAPFRFTQGSDPDASEVPVDDAIWPFDLDPAHPTWTPALATAVLGTYAVRYLQAGTKLIVCMPERDVMNAIGDIRDGAKWTEVPDNENGRKAIEDIVAAALISTEEGGLGLADAVIAWYLLDEPDLPYRRRWATPKRLASLRGLIKETEYNVRMEHEPAFAALTHTERLKRLRPVVLTLTIPFFMRERDFIPPENYSNAIYESPLLGTMQSAADMYGFDWYPFKRTQRQIDADYPSGTCASPPPVTSPAYLRVDPVISLRVFRQLRLRLNGSLLPGDDQYRGVFAWNQTDGFPFREAGDPISADRSPSNMKRTDVDNCLVAQYRRTKLYAALRLQQFYNWGSLLELSEGTAGFSQFNAPDIRLRDEFSQVVAETEFFGGIRYSSTGRGYLITARSVRNADPTPGDTRDFMPPAILYLDYLNQPVSALGTDNRWLIIVNRHFNRLQGSLTFSNEGFAAGFRFQRINFLQLVGASIFVGPTNGFTFQVDVPPYSVRIYQQRPA